MSFFLATETSYPIQFITEPLMPIQPTYAFLRPWIHWMMGSVSFAALDLSPQFRLWGLTLLMTRDLIQLTGSTKELAFVKLVNQAPVYSRPDIGWLVRFITWVSMYYNKNGKVKEEWDKVYFRSIRKAVVVAVLLRLGFTSVIFTWLFKK